MKSVEVLDWDDIIEPEDLVRNMHALRGTFSDDIPQDNAIYYSRAKSALAGWIGKSLRDYMAFVAQHNHFREDPKMMPFQILRCSQGVPAGVTVRPHKLMMGW